MSQHVSSSFSRLPSELQTIICGLAIPDRLEILLHKSNAESERPVIWGGNVAEWDEGCRLQLVSRTAHNATKDALRDVQSGKRHLSLYFNFQHLEPNWSIDTVNTRWTQVDRNYWLFRHVNHGELEIPFLFSRCPLGQHWRDQYCIKILTIEMDLEDGKPIPRAHFWTPAVGLSAAEYRIDDQIALIDEVQPLITKLVKDTLLAGSIHVGIDNLIEAGERILGLCTEDGTLYHESDWQVHEVNIAIIYRWLHRTMPWKVGDVRMAWRG